MSAISHFTTYPAVLRLPLSMTKKLLLCMVISFKAKGLMLNNQAIGEGLNKSPHTINKALRSLREKGLVTVVNARSRHRRIYPAYAESYLATMDGQVDEFYLAILKRLLGKSYYSLLGRPGLPTKGKKERERNQAALPSRPTGRPVGENDSDNLPDGEALTDLLGTREASEADVVELQKAGLL